MREMEIIKQKNERSRVPKEDYNDIIRQLRQTATATRVSNATKAITIIFLTLKWYADYYEHVNKILFCSLYNVYGVCCMLNKKYKNTCLLCTI